MKPYVFAEVTVYVTDSDDVLTESGLSLVNGAGNPCKEANLNDILDNKTF